MFGVNETSLFSAANRRRVCMAEADDRSVDRGASQRKHKGSVAVLFCDLSRSTQLARRMDEEEYAELLFNLSTRCVEIVRRHGGHGARVEGDALLAMFGYLHPHEDDGRRATEAAIDLHEAVRATARGRVPGDLYPLSLHSGIHAGRVLVQ